MIPLFLWIIIFVVSLAVLIKAAGFFTDSSEKIGFALGIPQFIVGVTIVSIGTSLPELVTSIFAIIRESSEIVVGDVVGSNIANILLILGVTAVMFRKKIVLSFELKNVDLPLLVGSSFFLAVMIWDGTFNFAEAIICLLGYAVYLAYTYSMHRGTAKRQKRPSLQNRTIIVLFVSAIFIYIGAKYTIESVISIAQITGIGKELIAVTAVALGTSLPELMVALVAARKGNAEMAVGDVLGSNIFNTFAVMGIPGIIGTITVPATIISFSLPVMLMATLLYLFITQDRQITKWEGWMLILFYVLFIGKMLVLF